MNLTEIWTFHVHCENSVHSDCFSALFGIKCNAASTLSCYCQDQTILMSTLWQVWESSLLLHNTEVQSL